MQLVRNSTQWPQVWPGQERGNQNASSAHLLQPHDSFVFSSLTPRGPCQWYLLTFGQGPLPFISISPWVAAQRTSLHQIHVMQTRAGGSSAEQGAFPHLYCKK